MFQNFNISFLFFPPQNEMDDVPFFDIQLPYELAINIFQYLNRRELGRCAQVSRQDLLTCVIQVWEAPP